MRFIFLALLGLGLVVGCGSDGGSDPGEGTGGAASADPNEYPVGAEVRSCSGGCPRGRCGSLFPRDEEPACSMVYPSPLEEKDTYCGSTDGSYCLSTQLGLYSVQCQAGKAVIQHCSGGCGTWGSGTYECG